MKLLVNKGQLFGTLFFNLLRGKNNITIKCMFYKMININIVGYLYKMHDSEDENQKICSFLASLWYGS